MTLTRRLILAGALTLLVGVLCFFALSSEALRASSSRPPPSNYSVFKVSALLRRASSEVGCEVAPSFAETAHVNAQSMTDAAWSVAGPVERGWRVYAPLVAREVRTSCKADQAGFARAVARWQGAHGLAATGVVGLDTLRAMYLIWLRRRPFIAATRNGACPPPSPDDQLILLRPEESYKGKVVRLHVRALDAYRRLVAAARAELPSLKGDPRVLSVFSGYRGPDEEAVRCSTGGACGTAAKARCSAHRTGMALDLLLDASLGSPPDATDDDDRARQVQSPAYRWLVANADRFGFVPYPYEPWHWEFAG